MRALLILAVFLIPWMFIDTARGDDAPPRGAPSSEREDRLDDLFVELKTAPNEMAAYAIEQKIWIEWTTPADPELAQLMDQALSARRAADYDKALEILNHVTADWGGYAEGWNQRATVHFLKGELEKALEDIAETLSREPRHFGALTGRGIIRLRQAKPALAMQNIRAAMDIHPFVRERGLIAALPNPEQPQ